MAIYSSGQNNSNGQQQRYTPTAREQKELDALLSDIYAGIEKLPDRNNISSSSTTAAAARSNTLRHNHSNYYSNNNNTNLINGYSTTPHHYNNANQSRYSNANAMSNGVSHINDTTMSNNYRSMPSQSGQQSKPLSPALRQPSSPSLKHEPQSLASFVCATTTPESKRRVRIIDNKRRNSSDDSSPSPPPVAMAHKIDVPIRYASNGDISTTTKRSNTPTKAHFNDNRFIYHQDDPAHYGNGNDATDNAEYDDDNDDDDDDGEETHVEVEYHERSWLDNKLGRLGRKRRSSKEMTERQIKEKAMIEELKRNLKNGAISLRHSFKGVKSKKEAEDEMATVAKEFRQQQERTGTLSQGTTPRQSFRSQSQERPASNNNNTKASSNRLAAHPQQQRSSPQQQPHAQAQVGYNKFATIGGRDRDTVTPSTSNSMNRNTVNSVASEGRTINLSAATPPLSVGPSPTPYTTSTLPARGTPSPLGFGPARKNSDVIGYGKTNYAASSSIPQHQSANLSATANTNTQAPVYANPHAALQQHKQANIKNVNQRSVQEFNELNSLLQSLAPHSSQQTLYNRQQQHPLASRSYAQPSSTLNNQQARTGVTASPQTNCIYGNASVQDSRPPTTYAGSSNIRPTYVQQQHQPNIGGSSSMYAQVQKSPVAAASSITSDHPGTRSSVHSRQDQPHRYGGTNMATPSDRTSAGTFYQQQQLIYGHSHNGNNQRTDAYVADVTETPVTDEGFVLPSLDNYQAMTKFTPVNNSYWYKPNISREAAINLLRDKPQGTFIVRDSTSFKGAFGLAVKVSRLPRNVLSQVSSNGRFNNNDLSSELIRHFLIEPTNKGVRLKGYPNEPVFSSLPALIYQHSITEIALPCKLIIPRTDIEDPRFNEKQRKFYQELDRLKLQSKAYANQTHVGSKEVKERYGDLYVNNEHRMIFK